MSWRAIPPWLGVALGLGGCVPPRVGAEVGGSCAGCHPQVAAEWRQSRHASAFTNPTYQQARHLTPPGWCDACHAPTLTERRAVGLDPGEAGSDGISCEACHLDDGDGDGDGGGALRVASTPSRAAQRAHRVVEDPTFGTPEDCGRCHQFAMPSPEDPWTPGPELAQSTLDEWRQAGVDEVCTDCHMGARGHRMPGAHDPRWVRDALAVRVEPDGDQPLGPDGEDQRRFAATLEAWGVGHAAPTGDPFRHVVVSVGPDPSCGREAARFGRAFELRDGHWAKVHDSTVAPGAPSRTLPVQVLAEDRFWCADYVLAADWDRPDLEPAEAVVRLGAGELTTGSGPAPTAAR